MIFALLIIFGLGFGSFVNAYVWRTKQKLDDDGEPLKLTAKQKKELSITKGRSMCPNCKHQLGAKDLIPVFSWLTLRGKCCYCHKPISWQYPLVELLMAVLFVVSYFAIPLETRWQVAYFVTWLFSLVFLVALAIYDAKYKLLPNVMLQPAYILVVVGTVMQFILGRPAGNIVDISGAVLVCSGLFWLIYIFSKGRWIGGGDIMLGLFTGVLIGTTAGAVLSLFVASVAGMLWSLPMLASKKANIKTQVPFGPFLIFGAIMAVLFGQQIINWYQSLVLVGL